MAKLVGCAPQVWSKFAFKLLTLMHADTDLEWSYNETHYGKGPMDEIGGTPFSAKCFLAKL